MVRTLLMLLLLILFNLSTYSYAKDPIRIIHGMVTRVSDGDIIQVTDSDNKRVKIRLYGIDAPETEKSGKKTGHQSTQGQPYGAEAYRALKGKIDGQPVNVEIMEIDRYNQAVSKVWIGKRNINLEMVRDGYAWAYRYYLDHYDIEYAMAEEQAKNEKRGLWQQNNPEPPWEFRKRIKRK